MALVINIIAIIEILIGLPGLFFLIYWGISGQAIGMGALLIPFLLGWSLIFFMGIGLLLRKWWARYAHNFFSIVVILAIVYSYVIFGNTAAELSTLLLTSLFLGIPLLILSIYFFTRPKVKEQFK